MMQREGDGSTTPVGYHTLGRVYPRGRIREYWIPHERNVFQKAPFVRLSVQAVERFLIASQAPVFNPRYGFISHVSQVPEVVYAPWPLPFEKPGDVTTIYGNYNASNLNYVILADARYGSLTITLPDVLTVDGLELQIKKIDSTKNVVTIEGFGNDKIDGKSRQKIRRQDATVSIVADADEPEWHIL